MIVPGANAVASVIASPSMTADELRTVGAVTKEILKDS
jgi:hypothetical protein